MKLKKTLFMATATTVTATLLWFLFRRQTKNQTADSDKDEEKENQNGLGKNQNSDEIPLSTSPVTPYTQSDLNLGDNGTPPPPINLPQSVSNSILAIHSSNIPAHSALHSSKTTTAEPSTVGASKTVSKGSISQTSSSSRLVSHVSEWIPAVSDYAPTCFKFVSNIGNGSNGVVHVGTDNNNNNFALKYVSRIIYEGMDVNEWLVRNEMTFHRMVCSHENITNVYGMYIDKRINKLVLVSEFSDGINLYEELLESGGYFPEKRAAFYVKSIAHALQHIHQMGIIHRDLKLANVMVSGSRGEIVKLIDFGDAIQVNMVNDCTDRCGGTNGYQAPEYIRGESFGVKMDMFSLGVVLYCMLYGRLPFTQNELKNGKLSANVDDGGGRNVSNKAKEFICGLLNANPAYRLSTMEVLSHPWILSN